MRKAGWAYLTVMLLVFFSCKKPEDRLCFKVVGEERQLDFEFEEDFDTLILKGDLTYEIVPDTVNKIQLIGGANLIKHIDFSANNGRLEIQNINKCDFLRDRTQKVKAKLHVKELSFLIYEGTNSLTFLDTIKSSELRVYNRDGAGTLDLLVSTGYLEVVVEYGWADYKVAGNSLFTYLACNTNSFCDARELKTNSWLNVLSNTEGDMLVNASTEEFVPRIHSGGNIKYTGTPLEVKLEQVGIGKLIQE